MKAMRQRMEKRQSTETITFQLACGTEIRAAVRRSRRIGKIKLGLDSPGVFVLTAPEEISFADLQKLAPGFLPWLEKTWNTFAKAENDPLLPETVAIPLLDTVFRIEKNSDIALGRKLSAGWTNKILCSFANKRIIAARQESVITLFGSMDDEKFCAAALCSFFRSLATIHLPPYIKTLAASAGYAAINVSVRNQRTRWGSCSRSVSSENARINLNWRALLLPVELLEHLCWHELAHLRQMNHSGAFYAELARHSPEWAEKEKLLTRIARDLAPWTAAPILK